MSEFGRDLWEAICSCPPALGGPPLGSFPDLCWFFNYLKMETPKPPWATKPRDQSLSQYT